MPTECEVLRNKPSILSRCPVCDAEPFDYFLRGQIQKTGLRLWWELLWSRIGEIKPYYCAVICSSCKEIIGYENIDGKMALRKKWRDKLPMRL